MEVNSTFYGSPGEQQLRSWGSRCAKGFEMGMKAPKAITHDGNLGGFLALAAVGRLAASVAALGDNLGPLLFQCPRTLKADAAKLRELREALRGTAVRRVAVEFRDESWVSDPEVRRLLEDANWALCNHPNTMGRATVKSSSSAAASASGDAITTPLAPLRTDLVTGDWVYVRLHGDNDEHSYDYSDAELWPYAHQVHEWRSRGLDCYVFFLNESGPPGCAMPKNARRFRGMLAELAGEKVPRAPKQPASTILNFFQPKAKRQKQPEEGHQKAAGESK